MSTENHKTIVIPKDWKTPKYCLGQHVRQGIIVGIEYYLPNSVRASKYGEGWVYWITPDMESEDTETFNESSIHPLTSKELRELIQKETDSHNIKLAALTEQLKLVEGVQP